VIKVIEIREITEIEQSFWVPSAGRRSRLRVRFEKLHILCSNTLFSCSASIQGKDTKNPGEQISSPGRHY